MAVIYKYQLKVDDRQTIMIPRDAQILTIQTQNNIPCIWALVHPDNEEIPCTFLTFGTGHLISDSSTGQYIGTYMTNQDRFVFHVFVEEQQ